MAFNGELLTIGTYNFPLNLIAYDTYDVSLCTLDLDSYRDANGVLHRNALPHQSVKVVFELKKNLTNTILDPVFARIRQEGQIRLERKALVKAYVPEIGDYITQSMYMADPKIKIKVIQGDTIIYDTIQITLVGY